MKRIAAPSLHDIHAARDRIASSVVRTPLIRLYVDAPAEIYLKLETLQPIGSFKLRGAMNALRSLPSGAVADGVYTASAGNMAQGVAWGARELGISCTVIVPDSAPRAKLDAIVRLGGRVVPVSYERWWQTLADHGMKGMGGAFIHPVADSAVMAGNGTVGLEIVEDLPHVSAVLVPFGGGGLVTGIAGAVRALAPTARIYGCEVDTAAPLSASLAAGEPVEIERTPSFVDGIGGRGVLPEMWPLVRAAVDGALVSSLAEVTEAVRVLVERARVVAEGAGAAPVAAALAGRGGLGAVVCVVSGGNIDASILAGILGG